MTDNKITREKTFSEELPYFKERIKEVFDNYSNLNGYEDPLHIAVLRDSKRIVRKAEEEINRQQAEIERLEKENSILSINADTAFQDGLNEAVDLYSEEVKERVKVEAVKEFAEKLKFEIINTPFVVNCTGENDDFKEGCLRGLVAKQNNIIDMIDTALKEMVGENNG